MHDQLKYKVRQYTSRLHASTVHLKRN